MYNAWAALRCLQASGRKTAASRKKQIWIWDFVGKISR